MPLPQKKSGFWVAEKPKGKERNQKGWVTDWPERFPPVPGHTFPDESIPKPLNVAMNFRKISSAYSGDSLIRRSNWGWWGYGLKAPWCWSNSKWKPSPPPSFRLRSWSLPTGFESQRFLGNVLLLRAAVQWGTENMYWLQQILLIPFVVELHTRINGASWWFEATKFPALVHQEGIIWDYWNVSLFGNMTISDLKKKCPTQTSFPNTLIIFLWQRNNQQCLALTNR